MLPEALRFQVGLIDQISKPLGNIQRQLNDVTNTYRRGTHTMMAGAAGMVGAGYALQQALMPAIEMDRVLGEVKSLGVADDQLKVLASTAMKFSVEYGKSATEFVASSYKIQSAISSLKGNELSEFTHISGVLAAATKADTETITGYMGQMHKIFNDDAVQMGNVAWAQKLAGQTATVVKMFNTEGKEMAAAFQNFQSIGAKNNIAMEEQFAVLGTLQAITQSGSRAGTQYSSFLQGVAKAQGKFGNQVAFQNQDGSMKSVIDIMGQLKTLYGDTLELSEQAQLKEAFGGQQAVNFIMNMMNETDGLNKSIKQLQDVSGLKEARDMAHSMTDQWERLEQGVFAVRTAFGAALLPSLLPVVSTLADGAMEIIRWTELFPNITKYVGYASMSLLGLVAAGGLLTIVAGAFSILISPITLIVTGIGLAIGAIVGLIVYWDKVKAAFGDTTMFKALENGVGMLRGSFGFLYQAIEPLFPLFKWIGVALFEVMKVLATVGIGVLSHLITAGIQFVSYVLTAIVSGVSLVIGAFSKAFQFLSAGWQWVMSGFTDTSGFSFIFEIADQIRDVFGNVFGWITEQFSGLWEMAKGVMDWIPGLGGDDAENLTKIDVVQKAQPRVQVQKGGAARSIANYAGNQTHYNVGGIHPVYMNNAQDFETEMEMLAG